MEVRSARRRADGGQRFRLASGRRAGRCAAWIAALSLILPGFVRAGEAIHTDILIQGGCAPLCLGAFDFIDLVPLPEQRSFPVVMEESTSLRLQTTAPGFVSRTQGLPPGWTPLPGDTDLLYHLRTIPELGRNLSYWDPSEATGDDALGPEDVTFGAVPDAEILVGQVTVGFLEFELTVADGANEDVGGSVVAETEMTGALHNHVSFFLYGDSTPIDEPGTPAADLPSPGVYLASLGLSLDAEGEPEAPSAFVAFGAGDIPPDALDAAIEWIDTVLVPEPGPKAAGLAVLIALASLARRSARARAALLPLLLLPLLLVALAGPSEAGVLTYTSGHTDIEVGVVAEPEPTELEGFLRVEGAVVGGEFIDGPMDFGADEILIIVPDTSQVVLSPEQIAFFGLEPIGATPGEAIWVLPQDQIAANEQEAPFLGIAGSEIEAGVLVDDESALRLVGMDGPAGGHFSAWQTTFDPPTEFPIATSDGIDANDFLRVGAGSHAHYNLGFTKPGSYLLHFEPTATLVGGQQVVDGMVSYAFQVPEPSAIWSQLLGVLTLGILSRRRRTRSRSPDVPIRRVA